MIQESFNNKLYFKVPFDTFNFDIVLQYLILRNLQVSNLLHTVFEYWLSKRLFLNNFMFFHSKFDFL